MPFIASGTQANAGCWPCDINCDGKVDGADLGILLAVFGTDSAQADFDENGIVDGADLGLMLATWGPVAEPPEIQLVVSPKEFLVGDEANVRYQVQIPPSGGLELDSVKLYNVQSDGTLIGDAFAVAKDNGNLLNGDDIADDGVFSALVMYAPTEPFAGYVASRASFGDVYSLSNLELIQAIEAYSNDEANEVMSAQSAAVETWQQLFEQLGDNAHARWKAITAMLEIPGIISAGLTEDGQDFWLKHACGLTSGILTNPEGTRGGPPKAFVRQETSPRASRAQEIPHMLKSDPVEFNAPGAPMGSAAFLPPNRRMVGSNNVLIWDAYNSQFMPWDEGPYIRNLMNTSDCPAFNVDYLLDAQATVDSVDDFTNYDTIVLVTHGWVNGFGEVAFLTRESVTAVSMIDNSIDLALGRIGIVGSVFSIRPQKIRTLAGSFDDAIIYNGSCESSKNATMQSAFFTKGADAYYGFTEVVSSSHAQNVSQQLFDGLVANTQTNGEAFDDALPKLDPTGAAVFTEGGARDLAYSDLPQNLGFEDGLDSWTVNGDGRWLYYLGEWMPTEGQQMGIISTGLGFTTSVGSLEQSFCLPANATHLEFDWNFLSEEMIEWCGPNWGYDDAFVVELEWSGGVFEVYRQEVDDLCGLGVPTSVYFDQSGPGCTNTASGYGSGGNDCSVHSTYWMHASIPISSIASTINGNAVTLRFRATDVGDSIFDTAVLLDDIEILTP
jgi:hypothetical protein